MNGLRAHIIIDANIGTEHYQLNRSIRIFDKSYEFRRQLLNFTLKKNLNITLLALKKIIIIAS